MASVTAVGNLLVLKFPYNPGLVAQIKSLPYTDRRWNQGQRVWMVDPQHGDSIVTWFRQYLGEEVRLPKLSIQGQRETRILEVHYLGAAKDRGDEKSAFALLSNGDWGAIFPEKVLRDWFEVGDAPPDQAATLFAVLAVTRASTPDEIKSGYRRMVKQWHPDLNKDVDAPEQFRRIQEAYEILSNPRKKARYEAGLALEASLKNKPGSGLQDLLDRANEYRAPLKCGYIMAEGTEKMGRFVVEKINAWADIVNPQGQTFVSSWPFGSDKPVIQWV